MELDSHI